MRYSSLAQSYSVERLAAVFSTGPNAEYPWEHPDGRILVPCTYPFKEIRTELESIKGRNLLKILEQAIKNHHWQKAFGIV